MKPEILSLAPLILRILPFWILILGFGLAPISTLAQDTDWLTERQIRYKVWLKSPIVDETAFKKNQSSQWDCPECPELMVIPPGTFDMGSPIGEQERDSDEEPQRSVRIGYSFAVSKFEVTFGEWEACLISGGCKHKPAQWGSKIDYKNQPVSDVSWSDVKEYVSWLSKRTGKRYRLLTEAEWEYAARAGTKTARHWGEAVGTGNANCNGCGSFWDGKHAIVVGKFPPNPFGLHDMLGNVLEWVEDCWNFSYAGAPSDGSAWLSGDCDKRVFRGGSWYHDYLFARAAARFHNYADYRMEGLGFRVAKTLP